MRIYRSFGIIPVNDDGRILMVCRKDTIGFMEFMKGNYLLVSDEEINKNEHPHIVDLFSMMKQDELKVLLNGNYDLAYEKLYGKLPSNQSKERQMFEGNKNIWLETCKKIYNDGKGGWSEAEWGFPKGKKKKNETEIDCASRELYEETGISNEMITIDKSCKFVEKRCEGNKEFIFEYYIGKLCPGFNIEKMAIQASEISDMYLFTVEECLIKIRHYFKNRIRIIQSLKNILSKK